jgi:diacylglycerol kinase family enzyme
MPPSARRVLVVANPAAGFRRGRDAGEIAARVVRGAGCLCELVRTRQPGDARDLAAAAHAGGFDTILAVGGDGTAHEAANGLAGTAGVLGVVPAGTMNLLARVLGVALDPASASETAVLGSRRITVRPGRAGETLFLLMAGIGFDAWVLRELLATRRGKIAFRHYVLGGLRGLLTYPYPAIRLELPRETVEATSAIVGRAPLYGGFLRPTPRVALDRETLEACAFTARSAGGLLRLLPALWSGAHLGRPEVVDRLATTLRAGSEHPDVPVQLDGELAGRLPMDFGISDRKLVLAC